MLKLALAGALAFALSSPVVAQECETLADVETILVAQNVSFVVVPDDQLEMFLASLGKAPDAATHAIVAIFGETPVYGLEIDGCMTPPVPLPTEV